MNIGGMDADCNSERRREWLADAGAFSSAVCYNVANGFQRCGGAFAREVNTVGRLVVLSGPSCVGKGPLYSALKKFYPELAAPLAKFVLHHSRQPRPGETGGVDYHFNSRDEIGELRANPSFLVLDVRGDLQAVDLDLLREMLASTDVFFDGHPFVVRELQEQPLWSESETLSVFLSPLTREEIVFLKERHVPLQEFITDVMRRKLLRRTKRQKGILSACDLEDVETRASGALREMRLAWLFDCVIPNHDGEDSENWDDFRYPVGDAHNTILAFSDLLAGRELHLAERWTEGFLG